MTYSWSGKSVLLAEITIVSTSSKVSYRTIYRLCCKSVKSYFSSLMEGSAILSKSYANHSTSTRYLGIPLTTEIIVEFITFGLDHIDEQIRGNAETILNLILKSKNMMSSIWMNIFEVLAPALPLLLCYASKKTALGKSFFLFVFGKH